MYDEAENLEAEEDTILEEAREAALNHWIGSTPRCPYPSGTPRADMWWNFFNAALDGDY